MIEATDKDIIGISKAQIRVDGEAVLCGDKASIVAALESLVNLLGSDGSWPPLLDISKDFRIGDVDTFEEYQYVYTDPMQSLEDYVKDFLSSCVIQGTSPRSKRSLAQQVPQMSSTTTADGHSRSYTRNPFNSR